MNSNVEWCQPRSLIKATNDAIKEALDEANNIGYTPDFNTNYHASILDEDKAELIFTMVLHNKSFRPRKSVKLLVKVSYGETLYGIDIDEISSSTDKLVMGVKIDNTLSPSGIKYLKENIIPDIRVYLSWLEEELDFDDSFDMLPPPINFDAIGYRG